MNFVQEGLFGAHSESAQLHTPARRSQEQETADDALLMDAVLMARMKKTLMQIHCCSLQCKNEAVVYFRIWLHYLFYAWSLIFLN